MTGMGLATLNDIFFSALDRNLDRVMLYRDSGKWLPISSREFGRNVARTAQVLRAWGIRPGDRIAILSENRPEWPTADIACLLLGAVTVPLYTTLTAEQTAFVLNDSGCRAIFVSSESATAQGSFDSFPDADRKDHRHGSDLEFTGDLAPFADRCVTMKRITSQGPDDLGLPKSITLRAPSSPDDLATIVYTSGTTGTSKGAMLTHGNITSNLLCSLLGFDMRPGLVSISFLPLCHITARHVDFAMLYHGVTLAYCPFIERLPEALREVQPSLFVAVPRVYEKIYAQAELKAKGFPKRAIFDWALSVGRKHKPEILAGRTPTSPIWKLANKLVFSQDSRRHGRARRNLHLRRRAARARTGRMVRHRRHPHSRRLRPHRNLPRHRAQYARETTASAPWARSCRISKSASRKTAKSWSADHPSSKATGIVPTKRKPRLTTAGSRPATSATSTPTDISRSPTARKI